MRVTKAIALLNLNDSFGVLNPTDFPLVAERPESAPLVGWEMVVPDW